MFQRCYAQNAKNIAVTILLALSGFSQTPAFAEDCDRACLTDMITQYVDALVEHDPSKLPLADNVRFTEDSRVLKLGEGLWQTVTAKGEFRQDYLDREKQIAATHQRVTPESRFQPTELGAPIRGMNDPVPADKKQSRGSMIRTALAYTEGLRIGNFTDGGTPFAPETYRVENGVITAGKGCGRVDCGMYSQRIILHPSIIASVAAVDEENGVVLLWMNFGHTGSSYGEGNALVTFEAFKVWGGEIHSINAFFRGLPVATARFWPSSDPIPSN
ncbi:MAG: hypothetical protein P8Y80_18400 [Acidobacteriota bacterium]